VRVVLALCQFNPLLSPFSVFLLFIFLSCPPLPVAPTLFGLLNEIKIGNNQGTSSSEETMWESQGRGGQDRNMKRRKTLKGERRGLN